MGSLVAALVGMGVALAFIALRARAWSGAVALGQVSFILILVVGGLGAILLIAGSNKGGDAGMAAMMVLFFGLLGVGVSVVAALLLGFVQGSALQRPSWPIARTVFAEVAIVALIVYFHQSNVVAPRQSNLTNDYWKQETARRNELKKLYDRIPEQYRSIDGQILNMREAQARELAKQGIKVPPMVPKEVEKAIRDYENVQRNPLPGPPLPDYEGLSKQRTDFLKGIVIGWILGAFGLPWLFPRPKAVAAPPIVESPVEGSSS
ncbi:MAG TPA: hypothetical protein PKA27_15960 [Fimbriimonadaceae bacterium]|nr:hypothetical protein [Fimbriimonadaceae bacterium]